MFSKIIILSGEGSGIVKILNVKGKMHCSVNFKIKIANISMVVLCGDTVMLHTEVVDGYNWMINESVDLSNMAIIIYRNNRVILSGASSGKCNANYILNKIRLAQEFEKSDIAKKIQSQKMDDLAKQSIKVVELLEEADLSVGKLEESLEEKCIITEGNELINVGGAKITDIEKSQITVEKVGGDDSRCQSFEQIDLICGRDGSEESFYEKIENKLCEMFEIHSHDIELEELVHDSEWVRVPCEDIGFYVMGVIKDGVVPIFICYGIYAEEKAPPISQDCHYEWLPLDRHDTSGRGFWMLYQDANTGINL